MEQRYIRLGFVNEREKVVYPQTPKIPIKELIGDVVENEKPF